MPTLITIVNVAGIEQLSSGRLGGQPWPAVTFQCWTAASLHCAARNEINTAALGLV